MGWYVRNKWMRIDENHKRRSPGHGNYQSISLLSQSRYRLSVKSRGTWFDHAAARTRHGISNNVFIEQFSYELETYGTNLHWNGFLFVLVIIQSQRVVTTSVRYGTATVRVRICWIVSHSHEKSPKYTARHWHGYCSKFFQDSYTETALFFPNGTNKVIFFDVDPWSHIFIFHPKWSFIPFFFDFFYFVDKIYYFRCLKK